MVISLIYTTIGKEHDAQTIIDTLLLEKEIACGVILSANSQYIWEEKNCSDEEQVLLLKTTMEKEPSTRAALEKLHPYELPAILSWNVQTNTAYELWVRKQTS